MKKDLFISYLHTTPPPVLEGTDAVHNEVDRLAAHFTSKITNLYPLRKPNSLLPRPLYGWHQWNRLHALDQKEVIHHVFSPTLAYYPVLGKLRNPIVFSISANICTKRPSNLARMQKWARIIVTNSREAERLARWGFSNAEVVPPGIDLAQFPRLDAPQAEKFTLLLASGPWEKKQFETKGINLLLQAVKARPDVRLILLWRGLFVTELRNKVRDLELPGRVEIIDRKVKVSEIMQRAHVTVLLVKEPGLVKAFPHSLVESLSSGRPVILSEIIPMADFVKMHGCGQVIKEYNVSNLIEGIETLKSQYQQTAANIPESIASEFSISRMIEGIELIYDSVI